MLTPEEQMQILKAAITQGSNVPVFKLIDQANIEKGQTAQTETQQEQGLRGSDGNTAMSFPESKEDFTTKGMDFSIDVRKYDREGNLVRSYDKVPPGIQNLSMGEEEGTVVETPSQYQKGGFLKNLFRTKKQRKIDEANEEILGSKSQTSTNDGVTIEVGEPISSFPHEEFNSKWTNISQKIKQNQKDHTGDWRYARLVGPYSLPYQLEQERLQSMPTDHPEYDVDEVGYFNALYKNKENTKKYHTEISKASQKRVGEYTKGLFTLPLDFGKMMSGDMMAYGISSMKGEDPVDPITGWYKKLFNKDHGLPNMHTYSLSVAREDQTLPQGDVRGENLWYNNKTGEWTGDIKKGETYYKQGKWNYGLDHLKPVKYTYNSETNQMNTPAISSEDLNIRKNAQIKSIIENDKYKYSSKDSYYTDFTNTNPMISDALGIENPYLAFGANVVLDPTTLVGGGSLLRNTLKNSRKFKNTKKVKTPITGPNPNSIVKPQKGQTINYDKMSHIRFEDNIIENTNHAVNKRLSMPKLEASLIDQGDEFLTQSSYNKGILKNEAGIRSSYTTPLSGSGDDMISLYRFGPTPTGPGGSPGFYTTDPFGPKVYGNFRRHLDKSQRNIFEVKVPVKDLKKNYANFAKGDHDRIETVYNEFLFDKSITKNAKNITKEFNKNSTLFNLKKAGGVRQYQNGGEKDTGYHTIDDVKYRDLHPDVSDAIDQVDAVYGGKALLTYTAIAESTGGWNPKAGQNYFQIMKPGLDAVKDVKSHPKNKIKLQQVKDKFGIDLATMSLQDVRTNPLANALVARLYYMNDPNPAPTTVEGIGKYWSEYYNTSADVHGTPEYFNNAVDEFNYKSRVKDVYPWGAKKNRKSQIFAPFKSLNKK